MCGLAGVARNPKGARPEVAIAVANELIRRMECRGKHATGIAVIGGSNPFIWKKAAPAGMVTRSAAWEEDVLKKIPPNFRVILGHTRHSTMDNWKEDRAAHPFKYGRIIGAHNGVIYNWKPVEKALQLNEGELFVDSQAAFAALRAIDDPVKATNLLKGWWALVWTRDSELNLTRTEGVPLAVAYAPEMKALFWASEMKILVDTLSARDDVGRYEAWETRAGKLYTYDTNKFSAKGTGVVKTDMPFTGNDAPTFSAKDRRMLNAATSTRSYGGHWNPITAQEDFPPSTGSAVKSVANRRSLFEQLDEVRLEVERLKDKMLALQGENDFLFELLTESGVLEAAGTDELEVKHMRESFAVGAEDEPEACVVPNWEETGGQKELPLPTSTVARAEKLFKKDEDENIQTAS